MLHMLVGTFMSVLSPNSEAQLPDFMMIFLIFYYLCENEWIDMYNALTAKPHHQPGMAPAACGSRSSRPHVAEHRGLEHMS